MKLRIKGPEENQIKILVEGGSLCRKEVNSEDYTYLYIYDTYPKSAKGKEIIYEFLDKGDIAIADAYLKGIKDFDVEKAYEAMKKDATTISNEKGRGRVGIKYYKALGFVPANKVKEATTRTLEFAYGDFCEAQMAKALNKNKDMEIFLKRAKNYQHVFDDSTGFMRGRNSDGSWVEPFNPVEWGGSFTEGCAWHYTFSVPHDEDSFWKRI